VAEQDGAPLDLGADLEELLGVAEAVVSGVTATTWESRGVMGHDEHVAISDLGTAEQLTERLQLRFRDPPARQGSH